jgi:steroid delta-isomerase-like uncharacterized protein
MATLARAELQTIIDRFMDVQRRGDAAGLAAFHTEDGIVESPMYGVRIGRPAIEAAYRAFMSSFPDFTVVLDSVIIEPPRLAAFATITATHANDFFGLAGTNRKIEMRLARLIEMKGDLIAHERRIYDFTGVLVQVGVLRAKPAKP